MFLLAVSKSLIQRVEDVMNLKWALGLGSHFLLSFLKNSFTVFCESLLMVGNKPSPLRLSSLIRKIFCLRGFTKLNIVLTHSAIMFLFNSYFSSHPPRSGSSWK
ncbi:hypothetical protein FXO38_19756 [Capsicum annuum]|uniref:Uncharacterized protein n=1 Tax=Capsicum annuum TaxID=4072 RepID=A0A2G2Y8G0_CAPAN|nr:hypothetical protein FXO38_19756 [Capsicum annuum]KAF3680017.1 hypothetical protein FXO37_03537 [Capsicum annuum]PHT65969.1 hypothetical protein T459_30394 [Capsicum annuum]